LPSPFDAQMLKDLQLRASSRSSRPLIPIRVSADGPTGGAAAGNSSLGALPPDPHYRLALPRLPCAMVDLPGVMEV